MTANHNTKTTPWQVQEQDFPRNGSSADKLKFLIRYAILAPSGHNSQPWKFLVGDDEIQIVADKTRWLKAVDPRQRELHIAVGCALENLLIAAEHFGYGHQVIYFPKPDQAELVATVKFMPQGPALQSPRPKGAGSGAKGQPSPFREPGWFDAIPARHTNRQVYTGHPISKDDLGRLKNCCVEKGVWLDLINDLEIKNQIKELLVRGHAITLADPAFRKETAYWIGKGIFNIPRPVAVLMQLAFPYLNVGWAMAPIDSRLIASASAVAVLSSSVDDHASQVKVGQVFERICLAATACGIRVHPMSPVVEIPELKAQVARLLPNPNVIPQHAFRLGYAEPVKTPAPRRALGEVLA